MPRPCFLIGLSLTFFIPLSVIPPAAMAAADLDGVKQAMRDRDWKRVLELSADSGLTGEDKVYVEYLAATARFESGETEEALAAYQRFVDAHKDSQWRVKAQYRVAECLMRLKRYEDAEKVYSSGVRGTMNWKRRDELAGVFLAHADKVYKPEVKDASPDYAKALLLYGHARDIYRESDLRSNPEAFVAVGPKIEETLFRIACCQFQLGQFNESLVTAAEVRNLSRERKEKDWVRKTPEIPGVRFADAYLLRGDCLLRMGRHSDARREWLHMERDIPDATQTAEAVYRISKTYQFPNPGNDNDLELGIKTLRRFLDQYPSHNLAPQAASDIADAWFNRGRYEEALGQYQAFLEQYAGSAKPELVYSASKRIGDSYQRLERFDDAVVVWKKFLAEHPVNRYWSEVQQAIIDVNYIRAETLLSREQYEDARRAYQQFLSEYPLDGRNPNILYKIGDIEFKQNRYKEAISAWEQLVSKYPSHDEGWHGQFSIAITWDEKLDNPEKALEELAKVGGGNWKNLADQRIREMKDKQLAAASRRAFRSDEKATVRLTTRNIEKLAVKAYPLDMEAYYRRLHTIRRVEDLDLSLIAPAKEWELPVEGYKQYRVIERDIDLPFEGSGAWAVVFGEEKYEAVTLVLKSDLQIIVKSSKQQAFVFAENARTDAPYAGVRIVLSDGAKVLNEGRTGEDGVYVWESGDLNNVAALSVLALEGTPKEGGQGVNIASNSLELGSAAASEGLQPRGIVYTDRPAFRPGDTVRFKSIIRLVKDGQYQVPADQSFRVEVRNAGGAVLYREELKAGAFGTLSGELALAEASPLGQYRITVSQKDGPSFEGTFTVAQFELPKLQIAFDLEKLTYFVGDEIKGRIRVTEFSGPPAAKRNVQYRLGRAWKSGVTDEKGELPIEFETWDFDESARLLLEARVDEARAYQTQPILLVTTGFQIKVESNRDLYLAGEPFSIHIKAESHGEDPKPITREFRVVIRQRRTDNPSLGWSELRTEKAATNDKGEADVTLTLDKDGQYEIRVEAEDDRGVLVHAERIVRVSGDEDSNRIIILTDTEKLKLGETPKFTIVSRLSDGQALITCEGEKVLRHEAVRLKKGKNEVSLAVAEAFAPHFVYSVSVIEASRFHQASKVFSVERDLKITVKVDKDSHAPGGKASLRVKTTDQNGRPVAADLSLALVDEAIFAIYPDTIRNFGEAFIQRRLAQFVNTMSTADFAYNGVTSELSQDVIGEKKRLVEAAGAPRAAADYAPEQFGFGERVDKAASPPAPVLMESRERVGDEEMPASAGVPISNINGMVFMELNGAALDLDDYSIDSDSGLSWEASDELTLTEGRGVPGGGGQLLGRVSSAGDVAFRSNFYAVGKQAAAYVPLRAFFPNTAYWSAHVITNNNGEGEVDITLPDTITTWKAIGRGVTVETLLGEGTASVSVKKDLVVEIDAPQGLVEGNEITLAGRVRNHTSEKQSVNVSFVAEQSGERSAQDAVLEIPAGEVASTSVSVKVASATGAVTVTLTAAAGAVSDGIKQTIPVQPWGVPVRVGSAGSANDDRLVELRFPDGVPVTSPSMKISLTPGADRSLLDFVVRGEGFGWGGNSQVELGRAALEMLAYLEESQTGDAGTIETLRNHIRGAVSALVAAQTQEGFWKCGPERSDVGLRATARNTEFISLAGHREFVANPDTVAKAWTWLEQQFPGATDNDKALIAYGLSAGRSLDFAWLNRLHRMTASLDDYALVHLALAWENQDRPEKAVEILTTLLSRKPFDNKPIVSGDHIVIASHGDRGEIAALTALAIFRLGEKQPPEFQEARKQGLEAILSRRTGCFWPSAAESLAVARALVEHLRSGVPAENNYRLTINVNDKPVRTVEVQKFHPAVEIAVPVAQLTTGINKINFDMEGRGDFTYSIEMEGLTRDLEAVNQWQKFDLRQVINLERQQTASPTILPDGREIDRGSGVAIDSTYTNPTIREVALGDTYTVRISVNCHQGPVRNLVIEEPLPPGFRAVPGKFTGSFDRYELQPGRIVFHCGARGNLNYYTITYRLRADHPGTYRVLPTRVYLEGEPGMARVGADYTIKALLPGRKPAEAVELSPDEKYHLGLWHADHENPEAAYPLLASLFDNYRLHPDPLKETTTRLLKIALNKSDDALIVKVFEVIKERFPDHLIPFEDVARIGEAYRRISEFERASYVERALLGSLFVQEGNVSGILQAASEYAASEEFMRGLILQYPDLPDVQTAVYALGQLIYSTVDKCAASESYRKLKVDRGGLLDRASSYLESFLDLYPANPIADEVSFTLANIQLDQSRHDVVVAMLERFEKRYPASRFLDSYEFTHAYALFAKGQYENALQLSNRVASEKYPGDSGEMEPSPDRYNALHMSGKINHAAGRLAEALARYQEVKDRFTDAARAVEYLTSPGLSVPEVTEVQGGRDALVKIRARNIETVLVRVYKVDLLTLALTERNLNNITGVNLAGIAPDHTEEVSYGETARFDWKEKEITLPLDKPGAYLLVLKGGDQDATGMMVRTNLAMDVQEDAVAGTVRANVRRPDGGAFVKDVVVKAIGSGDGMFKSGKTDLRGVFEADGLHGTATVVAKLGDDYCFHRGSIQLAQVTQDRDKNGRAVQSIDNDGGGVLDNVKANLRQIQVDNDGRWYEISQQDIKAQKADSLY